MGSLQPKPVVVWAEMEEGIIVLYPVQEHELKIVRFGNQIEKTRPWAFCLLGLGVGGLLPLAREYYNDPSVCTNPINILCCSLCIVALTIASTCFVLLRRSPDSAEAMYKKILARKPPISVGEKESSASGPSGEDGSPAPVRRCDIPLEGVGE
jgi:hypothetical protein